jgi:hypothetical protein
VSEPAQSGQNEKGNAPPQPAFAHHVFVDCENVHDIDPAVLAVPAVRLSLVMGPHQTKLPVDLVEKLLGRAHVVELIRSAGTGRNAIDFVLAYHLGRAAAKNSARKYYIVSRDTGFDPLIEHLRGRCVSVVRCESIDALPFLTAITPKPPPKREAKPPAAPAAPAPQ